MAEINYIRHQGNKKGKSYASIAEQTGRDVRTVQKYVEKEDWSPEARKKQTRPSPVMDPVKPIIDAWLKEDMKKNKKFRRTAKRIFELLQKNYGFKGSDRSVRGYVSQRKQELLVDHKAALPLEARPGTAQVDFGEAPFKHGGKSVVYPYLVMSFPYSNAFYFQVFQSQNQDCFLEGMKRVFHYIGGVPHTIRFDNLSPAVKKVLPDGERELTENFHRFALHYDFEYEFCNPGSGNEKGHVEAMVKYVRNNFLLPETGISDLEAYNQTLWAMAEGDRNRAHYQKGDAIRQLFSKDQDTFLTLPAKAFEVAHYETVKADGYGIVNVEGQRYSTSPRFAKHRVLAKVTHDEVVILNEDLETIVTHARLYGERQTAMNWQPYLTLIAKRPMAMKYTTFYDQLPEEWQGYLSACTRAEKQEALKLLADLLKHHDLSLATEALKAASRQGHPSADAIKHVFYQFTYGRGSHEANPPKPPLPPMPDVTRDLRRYDRLTKGGAVHA